METEMLKDHDAINALIKASADDAKPDKGRGWMPGMPEGVGRAVEAVWKIAFPLVTTAVASVVRVVVEKAIGG